MRLNNLFEDAPPAPQNPNTLRIIEVLNSLDWTIHIGMKINHSGGTKDLTSIVDSLKRSGIRKVDAGAMTLRTVLENGDADNQDKFEALHQIWHPDLDKPKEKDATGFHDEDEFEVDGPDLNGYEFLVGYYSHDNLDFAPGVDITAFIYDTSEAVNAPRPVIAWIQNLFEQTLSSINKQLV